MTISIKFYRGQNKIDMTTGSGPYRSTMFEPPRTVFGNIMTAGRDQGDLVKREPFNRRHTSRWAIQGDSATEMQADLARLEAFINSGTNDEPVELRVRSHDNYDFEPKWGQHGAYLRYEVISGSVAMNDNLDQLATQDVAEFTMELFLRPFAKGKQQRLARAVGGVYENRIGTGDGRSRGVFIPGSGTNLYTNPVFGNIASGWSNGWVVGGNLIAAENLNPEFILWDKSSAKVTATAASDNVFRQSLTLAAASHQVSCFVKLPSGGTVSSTQVSISYNGVTRTTFYHSQGDGWYRIYASVTGTGGAANTGIVVSSGYTIYVDGFQAEQSNVLSPFFYGDMAGCAWSSTVHASTSTRTAASMLVNATDAFDIRAGTALVVWKTDRAHTAFVANGRIFGEDTSGIAARWDMTSNLWSFTDGTNTINSAADTFAANQLIILHFTWGPSGLVIYKNGSSVASGATYTPPTLGSNVNIGATASATNHLLGTLMGVTFFDQAMTAAEVLADYNNVYQAAVADRRVDWLPYEWTWDGDGVIDSCIETGKYNYALLAGIPGSAQADTTYYLSASTATSASMYASIVPTDYFINPNNRLFFDSSGTVPAYSATACGGQVYQESISSTDWDAFDAGHNWPSDRLFLDLIAGKNFHVGGALYWNSANTLRLRANITWQSGQVNTEEVGYTNAGTQTFYVAGPLPFWSKRELMLGEPGVQFLAHSAGANVEWEGWFNTAAANVDEDFTVLFPDPFAQIDPIGIAAQYFIVRGKNAKTMADSNFDRAKAESVFLGEALDIYPDKVNLLLTNCSPLSTRTMTLTRVYVRPRYVLL